MTVMPAVATGLDDVLAELSRTLWKQRGLIELLQYRLDVQQLILAAAKDSRLQMALEEVEAVMEDIRRSERARDTVVRRAAVLLALPETVSLLDIREHVDEPWKAVLGEHHLALLTLVAESERLASLNREMAQRGAKDSRQLLDSISGSSPTTSYGPSAGRNVSRPALIDRAV